MLKLPRQVKSIKTILRDGNDILHSLVTQSQELKSIEEIIASNIPFEFAVCGIKSGCVTLTVSKATEATNIMYREETILSALSVAGISAKEIRLKVRPSRIRHLPIVTRTKISKNAAETVSMQAIEIEDNAISSALAKLSETLKQYPQEDTTNPS